MKVTHLLMLFLLVLLWALPASAQYTLYGAPEVVQLPPVQTNAWMQRTYPTTTSSPVLSPISPAYGTPSVPVKQPRLVPPEGSALQSEPGAQAGNRPSVVASMFADPDACRPLANDGCGVDTCGCGPICCEPCCRSPWFASAGFITMGRNKANRVWTSSNSVTNEQLTNTDDIYMDWGYGGEIRFGRRFCGCDCQTWGIEAVYWSMKPIHGYLSTTCPDNLNTPLIVNFIHFESGDTGLSYFDGAAEQRLWRRNEFHNVEINLLRGGATCCNIPCWNVQWSVGVRFFRFEEDLKFGSLRDGFTWGQDSGRHEAYIDEQIKNNLVGFQMGFDARSNCWHNLQLYFAPKLGIYNNYIENTYTIYRGDGDIPVPDGGGSYPVHATDNVFSVLTEIDMGLYWHATRNWSAKIGYRLVAISNMGLADHQFIHYVNDVPELAHIKSNGDMLLHGAYVGITYNY